MQDVKTMFVNKSLVFLLRRYDVNLLEKFKFRDFKYGFVIFDDLNIILESNA